MLCQGLVSPGFSASVHSSPGADHNTCLEDMFESMVQNEAALSVTSDARTHLLGLVNTMDAELQECCENLQTFRHILATNITPPEGDIDLDHLIPLLGPDLHDEWLAVTRVRVSAVVLMEYTLETWQHGIERRSEIIQHIKDCMISVSP